METLAVDGPGTPTWVFVIVQVLQDLLNPYKLFSDAMPSPWQRERSWKAYCSRINRRNGLVLTIILVRFLLRNNSSIANVPEGHQ